MQKLQQSPAQAWGRGCLAAFALIWTCSSCIPLIGSAAGILAALTNPEFNLGLAELLASTLLPAVFTRNRINRLSRLHRVY